MAVKTKPEDDDEQDEQDQADDVGALCWMSNAKLQAVRAKQNAIDSKLADVDEHAIRNALVQLEVARTEAQRQRQLRAAGAGTDSLVSKAEQEVLKKQHDHDKLAGQAEVLKAEARKLRVEAALALAQAQNDSAESYRSEAARVATQLARVLAEAARLNDRLRDLKHSAERSFSWASAEAAAHGHRAGLADDLDFRPLVRDSTATNGGQLGEWLVRTAELRGAVTAEERQREEQRRIEQEARARLQQAWYERRSQQVWGLKEV